MWNMMLSNMRFWGAHGVFKQSHVPSHAYETYRHLLAISGILHPGSFMSVPLFHMGLGCIENWNPSPSHGLEASGRKPQVA